MANELRHSDVGTALSKSEWEAVGGHIFNSQAAGDIMYASTTSQLTRLGIGTANQVLATNSGATAPEWVSSVALATLATTVTISANNSTDETVYPVFVDGATGTQGAETDTGLTYNPNSGVLTATQFTGAVSGTASLATLASTVTVIDSTDTSSYIAMFDSATGSLAAKTDAGITYNAGTGMLTATGFTGPLTGNASGTAATVTGAAQSAITSLGTLTTLTVDSIIINGTNIGHTSDTDAIAIASDGVVTMNQIPVFSAGINVSGGTIAGTLATAAQGSVTSLGTLTALQVDYANINASTLTITDSTDTGDYASLAVTTHGATTLTTVDDDATAAHLTLDVDGNIELNADGGTITFADAGSGLGTITSSGYSGTAAVATTVTVADSSNTSASVAFFESATGDLGAKTDSGLTYNAGTGVLTATGFAGPITGNVTGDASGSAATVTTAAQGNITSLGTLTTLTVDNVITNGTTIGHTDDTDLMTLADGVLSVAGTLDVTGSLEVATIDYQDGDLAMTIADGGGVTFAQNIQTANIELGHASDTTIARSAAGKVTIEDKLITTAGKMDMWIPAAAMRPSSSNGCAAITDVETTSGRPDLQVLDFDKDSDEFAQFSIGMPQSWDVSETCTFQAYWTSAYTDTGTVAWAMSGVCCGDNDTIDVAYATPVVATAKAHSGTVEDLNISAESGAVTITNAAKGELVFFEIFRDVSADDHAYDARLIGVKLTYTIEAENDA